MNRKIIIIIICIVLLIGVGILYLNLRSKFIQKNEVITYQLIPNRATLVVEADNFHSLINKLRGSNIIWADLINIPFWNNVDRIFTNLENEDKLIDKIIVSAMQTSGSDFEFISYIKFYKRHDNKDIQRFFESGEAKKEETIEDLDVYSITYEKSTLFFYNLGKQCVVSPEKELLKESIQVLKNGANLHNSETFNKAYTYAGNDLDGNVLVNFNSLPILFRQTLSKEGAEKLEIAKQFGNWVSLDLIIKPNQVNCNGFITINDSSEHHILNLLKDQVPVRPTLFDIIPKYTSFFFYLGLSNFNAYYQGINPDLSKYNLKKTAFTDAFGNEFALIYIKKAAFGTYDKMAILKVKDKEKAKKVLGKLKESGKLNGYFLEDQLGKVFSDLNAPYYFFKDNFVVFTEEEGKGQIYFDEHYLTNAITTDINFIDFNENFSWRCNVFSYLKPGSNKLLLSEYFSDKSLLYYDKYDFLFDKFEAIGAQINVEKEDLFYLTLSTRYNPTSKKYPSLLWEFQPENLVTKEPFYFTNHYNNLKELFFQDINHNIYLISTTGKLLWKKELDGEILGDIYQVDAYKNGKFQLLFATKDYLYLLDRNGKKVDGFPIRIEDKITSSGIHLMDYDNNRNYRILIPTENKKLLNYDINGKKVDGWDFSGYKAEILTPIRHFALNKKDYIVSIDEKGNIYVIDRRGESRMKIKEKAKIGESNTFYISKGNDLKNSSLVYTDNVGSIQHIYFNDKRKTITLKEHFSDHKFLYTDFNDTNGDEYIFADQQTLNAYDADENILTSFQTQESISSTPKVFTFNGTKYLGFVVSASNQIYLIDIFGKEFESFPLEGNTSFPIQDINNDGVMDLAVGTREGTIRVYSLTK